MTQNSANEMLHTFAKERPLFKINENIAAKRYDESVAGLSAEKIAMIKAPLGKEENLITIKRTRKLPEEGDVFVLSYKEGIYFFGKVLEKIRCKKESQWEHGCYVILIFKGAAKTKDLSRYKPDVNNLLIPPQIVYKGYWGRGMFETIANIPLTQEEKNLDYGFFSMGPLGEWGSFYKANNEAMDHIPKVWDYAGVVTYTGIYSELKKECIINPDLLKTE